MIRIESSEFAGSKERVILLVVKANGPSDRKVIQAIVNGGSLAGASLKVLPFDSTTKNRILMAGADLVLLDESIGRNELKRLARDLEQDFRTAFLPVIFLKACTADGINYQADANALRYGNPSQEDGFFGFIRQVIQGREAFGTAMVERWLKKAKAEMGTTQILLDCLNDIALRVEALEDALVAQVMENIRALTHSLKGGAGTLRMSEVYLKISDLEAELGKKPLDMEMARKEFSAAKEMFSLIPKKYLDGKWFQPEKQKQAFDQLLILVVDDNIENRKLIAYTLKRLNLYYKEAKNGAVALEMLHKESFHLVLLDFQMPVMDGLTTLKRIREDSTLKDLHVMMQTANTSEKDIRAFFQAGCDDYISKPINLVVLQQKLEDFIAGNMFKEECLLKKHIF